MLLASRIFAGIAGVLHVWIWVMESLLWMNPAIHGRFGVADLEKAEVLRQVFFNQGFYNLFLALGALYGVFFFARHAAARVVMVFACLCILGAGLTLLFSAPHLLRAAVIQAAPPLIALVLYYLGSRK